jgi:tetratricopeptide (TPR) repeat protein
MHKIVHPSYPCPRPTTQPAGILSLLIRTAIILGILFSLIHPAQAENTPNPTTIQIIKNEWETTFYATPEDQQLALLKPLSIKAESLIQQFPQRAEPLIVAALIQCSLAANEGGFSALGHVKKARSFVERALAINPLAMDGSAYVILGNLYYRLPGWPISFGDNEIAKSYLETAVRLFPNGLDSNYFYGDFLLDEGEPGEALPFLEKADAATIRPESRLSDLKLKEELKVSLANARGGKGVAQGFYNQFLTSITK